MPTPFDQGYGEPPFDSLATSYPGPNVYKGSDFRSEWGPVFHRGRLDGTARVLVIGQDPAQHETIARRILVGEAGHRLQGFLFKLGVDRSYVMINTFLYCLFGQGGAAGKANVTPIVTYRHKWLDAVFDHEPVEAVVALGMLAGQAWEKWAATPKGSSVSPAFVKITHPTQPESASGGNSAKHAQLIAAMLSNWNAGLQAIKPAIANPDKNRPLKLYGSSFAADEKKPIPMDDLPAGTPPWMATDDGWADRTGSGSLKRRTITVTVPKTAV
ncbi:MAG: uracil-DNA glycosylase [Solirubrobacteraceae bacterium]